ncbi:hypothetical protein Bbelb_186770 [Branchiostoma belcheri]|nr:hypothetical protein Bbelb_186770 [Branchiostoma belcheri]
MGVALRSTWWLSARPDVPAGREVQEESAGCLLAADKAPKTTTTPTKRRKQEPVSVVSRAADKAPKTTTTPTKRRKQEPVSVVSRATTTDSTAAKASEMDKEIKGARQRRKLNREEQYEAAEVALQWTENEDPFFQDVRLEFIDLKVENSEIEESDLTFDIPPPPVTTLSKINDIQKTENNQEVSVQLKITSMDNADTINKGSKKLQKKASDETGSIRFVLWEPDKLPLEKGHSYNIKLRVKTYNGRKYLSTTPETTYEQIPDLPIPDEPTPEVDREQVTAKVERKEKELHRVVGVAI